MENLLDFTKHISGMNLIDYVIKYIDQNMILYRLMEGTSYIINAKPNTTSITYDITGISENDMVNLNQLPEVQEVVVYGTSYTVTLDRTSSNNKLTMTIS